MHTLLCYRKLIKHRADCSFSVIMTPVINTVACCVNTLCGYTLVCILDTMRHSPHLCVCLVIAKIRRHSRLRKCSYQGDGNQHPERSYAAIRLQSLLCRAWEKNQATPQGERADTPGVNRATRLSPDPDTADRKGRRHLDSNTLTSCRNLPNPNGEAGCRHWSGGEHRTCSTGAGGIDLPAPRRDDGGWCTWSLEPRTVHPSTMAENNLFLAPGRSRC